MRKGGRKQISESFVKSMADAVPFHFSFWHYAFPIVAGLFLLFIWMEWYKPEIENQWIKGSKLVSQAQAERDYERKKKLLDEGGNILRAQLSMHPYHARLWHFYAYYFYVSRQWDSCIFYQRKTLEFGPGAFTPKVLTEAIGIYNEALRNLLIDYKNDHERTIQIIDRSEIPGFYNSGLDKLRGISYMNSGNADSSIAAFRRVYLNDAADIVTLSNIAQNFLRTGRTDSAVKYAEIAKKRNPNATEVIQLFNQLNH